MSIGRRDAPVKLSTCDRNASHRSSVRSGTLLCDVGRRPRSLLVPVLSNILLQVSVQHHTHERSDNAEKNLGLGISVEEHDTTSQNDAQLEMAKDVVSNRRRARNHQVHRQVDAERQRRAKQQRPEQATVRRYSRQDGKQALRARHLVESRNEEEHAQERLRGLPLLARQLS